MRPENYLYTETHEWIRESGDEVHIGLTDHAIEELQDLVFLDLVAESTSVDQDDPIGEIESVKAIADIYAPVSGKIIDVNTEVETNLDILHEDPFEKGWLIKMELTNPSETDELLSVSEYNQFIADE